MVYRQSTSAKSTVNCLRQPNFNIRFGGLRAPRPAPPLIALTMLALMLGNVGCGARVVGRVPCAELGEGAFVVQGAAKCGWPCAMHPFAYNRNRDAYCHLTGNAEYGEQCDPATLPTAPNFRSTEFHINHPETGLDTVIHCIGPQSSSPGNLGAIDPPSETRSFHPIDYGSAISMSQALDECLLSSTAISEWGRQAIASYPWIGVGSQRAWCNSAPVAMTQLVQLDFDTPAQVSPAFLELPEVIRPPTLAAFFGEKASPSANPNICVNAANSGARLLEGGRLLNILTTVYGGRSLAGALPPEFPPTNSGAHLRQTLRYCFIDRGSVEYRRSPANPGCAQSCRVDLPPVGLGLQPNRDPGLIIGGVPLTVSNTSTLEMWSNGNLLTTANVSGLASGYFSQSIFILSDLELTQTAAVTASGHTISNGYANISHYWTGGMTGTGALSVPAGGPSLFVRYSDNGSSFEQTIVSASTSTGTRSGSSATLQTEFVDGAMKFVLNLVMTDAATRPTAVINSVSNTITGQPIIGTDLECHYDTNLGAGISITATGTVTNGSPTWHVDAPNRPQLHASGSNTFSEFVPLLSTSSAMAAVTLDSWQSGMLASARRDIRAVDTVSPTISSTQFSPNCGWGRTLPPASAPQLGLCAPITGNFSDSCDAQPRVNIVAVRIYAWPSGALLENRISQSGNCLQVYANAINAQLSNVDYEVDYTVSDTWNNSTTVRHWKGYFTGTGASTTCAAPAVAVTASDN